MTNSPHRWIEGATRTGKTTRLIGCFAEVLEQMLGADLSSPVARRIPRQTARQKAAAQILVFAATGDNRIDLTNRLIAATQGQYPIQSTTPLGFFEDEVFLFWPLLSQHLNLKVQFPLRLRPETEQELATRLWQPELDRGILTFPGLDEQAIVRRCLDFLQLAALAGTPTAQIPEILAQGLPQSSDSQISCWATIGDCLERWRNWCWQRGLLTYGLIADLYGSYLLPNTTYQRHLRDRYRAVLADDVDNYPAIAADLCEVLLEQGAIAVLTYNPNGAVRFGLGADPAVWQKLTQRCQVESRPPSPTLASTLADPIWQLVDNPIFLYQLPGRQVQVIQTVSRAQLLRQTAEAIQQGIQSGQVAAQDIAVIAPGLDPIARYTLSEILGYHHIATEPLNEQRPLATIPLVRGLLTLLTLVYPGLGRLIDREAIAEMLALLSMTLPSTQPTLDPVRAGLLADYCFAPHPDDPQLLEVETFPRWDRLGYQATETYRAIRQWVTEQKQQQQQRLIPSPLVLLDRAIQQFLAGGNHLPYHQIAALRELAETAQHYWEVDGRLRQMERASGLPASPVLGGIDTTVENFIQLLWQGTVTANPFPVRSPHRTSAAVTLANVYQYRVQRLSHRWQFWLDVGSTRWLQGTDLLFAAPLFLRSWSGKPLTEDDMKTIYNQRLQRILFDLLGRTDNRLFLCHSELATNGQEQMGSLLNLVNAAPPYDYSGS